MKIAVIGGGISGLSAAWELRDRADVTLFEAKHLGGCIKTTPFLGCPVDEGPDAFITRAPHALELCSELGIDSQLVAPSAGRAAIWLDGRVRPLPEGLVLGIPTALGEVFKSGFLSPLGTVRAAIEPLIPHRSVYASATVRQLVADRMGAQVADRLVAPLIGSIYAGSVEYLGAQETVPQLVEVASGSRSLLLGLRRLRRTQPNANVFLAPLGGMGQIVDALKYRLNAVEVIHTRADRVCRASETKWLVEPFDQQFDAVIIATPARAAGTLLGHEVRVGLESWQTASVAMVTARLSGASIPEDLSGFLVPEASKRLMTACSFASNKWPHWINSDGLLVRISAGRFGDSRAMELDDADLVKRLLEELQEAMGAGFTGVEARVSRFPDSFPQYCVGHARRVEAIERYLDSAFPGIYLAGSSYRGIGIPACIASGRRAAQLALETSRIRT